MMTSAVKRTNKSATGGFTLLEIVVVLSIAVLIVGGGLSAMYFNRDEARLTDAYQSIEVLAKRARTISTLQQRPYALEFNDKSVSLMPYAEAILEGADRDALLDAMEDQAYYEEGFGFEEEDAIDRPSEQPPVRDVWVSDEDMQLSIRRWASSEWVALTPRVTQVWRFDPSGISEPVALRVEVEGSWVEFEFHPLTAAIARTESEIR